MPEQARLDLAEQKAMELHRLHANFCRVPVNPVKVANSLGVKVLVDNSDTNKNGWYDGITNIIYLNTDLPLEKKRFTVAHELGHHVMQHGTRKKYTNEDADPFEIEANRFAIALLMPVSVVRKCVFVKEMSVEGMADFFGVSERVVCVRLKQLKIVS